jgi:hypothetical protein
MVQVIEQSAVYAMYRVYRYNTETSIKFNPPGADLLVIRWRFTKLMAEANKFKKEQFPTVCVAVPSMRATLNVEPAEAFDAVYAALRDLRVDIIKAYIMERLEADNSLDQTLISVPAELLSYQGIAAFHAVKMEKEGSERLNVTTISRWFSSFAAMPIRSKLVELQPDLTEGQIVALLNTYQKGFIALNGKDKIDAKSLESLERVTKLVEQDDDIGALVVARIKALSKPVSLFGDGMAMI